MKDNDKFLKPGTGKPVRPGIKPPAPRPVGNSGATTKPAIKPPQIAAVEAMRKKQASR